MINNETHRNAFINSAEHNLNHTNSLKHLLNDSEDEHDEHGIISLSTYTDVNILRKRMSDNNSLYKTLLQTDPNSDMYSTLQTNYKTYKSLIRRSIMLAKRKYSNNITAPHLTYIQIKKDVENNQ